MASSDSKWVPKHSPDLKTSFGSPHAPYGYIKNFFTKSIFQLENAFFKLEPLQSFKKRIFSRSFADSFSLTARGTYLTSVPKRAVKSQTFLEFEIDNPGFTV